MPAVFLVECSVNSFVCGGAFCASLFRLAGTGLSVQPLLSRPSCCRPSASCCWSLAPVLTSEKFLALGKAGTRGRTTVRIDDDCVCLWHLFFSVTEMASVTKRPSTGTGGIPAAASPSLSPSASSASSSSDAPGARRGLLGLVRGLLFDHAFFPLFFVLVMLGELVLGVAIIQRVACQW